MKILETYDLLIKYNKAHLEKLDENELEDELNHFKSLSIIKEELNLNNEEILELSQHNCLKA